MPEDMDVLIGRIKVQIKVCQKIRKEKRSSTYLRALLEGKIDAFNSVLHEIEQIATVG